LSVWLEKIDARKPRRSAGKRKAKRVRGSASKTGDKR
jgi:hypothetical protein